MSTASTTTLARVVRPQGRRGEVLCDLFTDFPERFRSDTLLSLHSETQNPRPITVEDYWLPKGRSAGRIVLKLEGVNSISEAEALAGCEVQWPTTERASLESGNYYVSDMVGCDVLDGSQLLGKLSDVQFPVNVNGQRLEDAPLLLMVSPTVGEDVLIPFANSFVEAIDLQTRRIVLNLPKGLADLNG